MKKMLAILLPLLVLLFLAGCGENVFVSKTSSIESGSRSQEESVAGKSSGVSSQDSSADSISSEKTQGKSESGNRNVSSISSSSSDSQTPSSSSVGGSENTGAASLPTPPESSGSEQPAASETPSTPPVESSKPEEETDPPPTLPPNEPAFDISQWVGYAKRYGTSDKVGLILDSSATSCSDNPITAGPNTEHLERDIRGMLDWYKAQGFTRFYCWYEAQGDGTYFLYIGYA